MALDTVVNRDPSIGIIQMLPWGGMSLGRHKLRVLVGRLLAASTGLIKKLLFLNEFRRNHEPVGKSQQSGQGCSKT
jgi:hypothetical protein